ncbi:MAG: alkaline phosphatase family protein [Gaiellaceae bacterium]
MPAWDQPLSRRRLLGAAAAAAAGGAGPLATVARAAMTAPAALPSPAHSGIDHVVVVMMENRSFDHVMGWLPGADGKQAGLAYVDASGAAHTTFPLAPDFQGCAYADPDHSYDGARVEWNGGACDGWLRANDRYSIGYYRQQDLPFLGKAAPAFTACDRFFASYLGPTFPNRFYSLSAATDRDDDGYSRVDLPTIFDRFAAKSIPAAYYYGSFAFLLLYQRYQAISHPYSRFFAQCKTGKLPAFSYIDPNWTFHDSGPSSGSDGNDDHPHADIRAGEYFLSTIYNAITRSPAWPRTLLAITFDEWGWFFDHVSPAVAPGDNVQRGFRVPCLLISPFARRGHVAHGVYDHTSILKMVEWRWGLAPLTARDAAATNLAGALDFSHPVLHAPRIVAPRVVTGAACPA